MKKLYAIELTAIGLAFGRTYKNADAEVYMRQAVNGTDFVLSIGGGDKKVFTRVFTRADEAADVFCNYCWNPKPGKIRS